MTVHSWINRAQRDQLLADSDVFVLPSYLEGVPMSMLEAMATALPVITSVALNQIYQRLLGA